MIYLLYGDNIRLIKLEKLIYDIKEKYDITTNSIYFPETIEEISTFISEMKINDLFSNKKIYVIKNFESLDAKNKKQILEFVSKENINEILGENTLIISTTKDTKDKNILSLINLNIEKKEYKSSKKDLVKYIQDKINISNEDAMKLLEVFNDDMHRMKNEVDKLSLMFDNENVSYNELKKHIYYDYENDHFSLIENILKGNLENLEKENIMMLISVINKEILQLYYLNLFYFQGDYEEFKKFYTEEMKQIFNNSHPYPIFKKLELLKKFPKSRCIEILDKMHKLEYGIKNGIYDKDIQLTMFISSFKD